MNCLYRTAEGETFQVYLSKIFRKLNFKDLLDYLKCFEELTFKGEETPKFQKFPAIRYTNVIFI